MPHDGAYEHAEAHRRADHHVGACDEECRAGRRRHAHLYRGESGAETRRRFVRTYAKQFRSEGESAERAQAHARRVYGATVGKIKRAQEAARRRMNR